MTFITFKYLYILVTGILFSKLKNINLKNFFLLILSYTFYLIANNTLIIPLLISTLIDYLCAIKIHDTKNNKKRKTYFYISIVTNFLMLFTFKYFYIFRENFNYFSNYLNFQIPYINIVLPVAISFYTFQTVSYTIDVYNKKIFPERDFLTFALYVTFFPQLVAGPIERASSLLPQLKQRANLSESNLSMGFNKITLGILKKVVIGDNLRVLTAAFYNNPSSYNWCETIFALLVFSIQIYCDFSGYTDIAIGSAKMMGIDLRENFLSPYSSKSLSELWKRWHISLTSWFGDYIYKPLRTNNINKTLAIFVVFSLMGIWHGARWTFFLFGITNFLGLLIERPMIYIESIYKNYIPSYLNRFISSLRTHSLWILCGQGFIAHQTKDIFTIYEKLFKPDLSEGFSSKLLIIINSRSIYLILIIAIMLFIYEHLKIYKQDKKKFLPNLNFLQTLILWIIIIYFGNWHESEFIYFRF